jgi:excisionase family DNA binding protein
MKEVNDQVNGVNSVEKLVYSVRDCAQALGVSEKTIRRLVARGLIRPSRALRHLLIPRTELDRFLRDTL